MLNVAIIGSGPTAIYTAKYLIAQDAALSITMFESQAEAGKGTPYHQSWNSDVMLANIASIEIPPITETLVEWLGRHDDYELACLGLTRDDIDERKFYPRVTLGDYFHDQLLLLAEKARLKNIPFSIKVSSHVEDVIMEHDGVAIIVQHLNGSTSQLKFSHVIMATGHSWSKHSEVRPGYFISPWPPVALNTIGQVHTGILGTSLSAIDAMVTLAVARGTFISDQNGIMKYLPEPGTEGFRITLMSRKGLLPEADFYYTLPYLPLKICTAERIDELVKEGGHTGLLDKAFFLFKAELIEADLPYAKNIGLENLNLEQFCQAYFKEREECDPFTWAKLNLAEAKENQARKYTVEWRYAILRMHEIIGRIVPYLSADDYQRFSQNFKPVFVDNYATVPHESIERLLALRAAGKLDIISLGADYELDKETPEQGVILVKDNVTTHFPAFIEATGQRGLLAQDFPFPSLWQQGIINNATVADDKNKKRFNVGGIDLDMAFHPVSNSINAYRLYCPSIPFMLGQFPFAQGITSSHEIGKIIAEDISRQSQFDVPNLLPEITDSYCAIGVQ